MHWRFRGEGNAKGYGVPLRGDKNVLKLIAMNGAYI